ncbi:MAG TPA: hypothetical protein VD766_10685, partial [Solirubrobacterales bacterium]|nr:hypothetical protein [Solirubrobacterales bacterium]
ALKGVPDGKDRFNFGWKPPSQGGPSEIEVKVGLSPDAWQVAEAKEKVKVKSRPYSAFTSSRRLPIG